MLATINGISLNYDVSGAASGAPVVLHHPLATRLGFWDELTAALAPRYRVIRFDARGHGRSDAPATPYDFPMLCADVTGLMDHLGIARAAFVGLSMGGMVGQYLGVLHPDRVSSLVLVSTTSRIPPEMRPMWSDRVGVVRKGGMASQVGPAMDRWITAANRAARPDLVARLSAMIADTPPDGYIGWCHAIGGLDVTEQLKTITTPTRVIVGAEDPSMPPAVAQVIHETINGSELVVMPAVSHQLALEDPASFHGHVLEFLARQPG
ncbi:MAG: alpha/beta fold hydrolase [Hyphomicrobiaceae bacterium]